jgi:hypothetical protein
MFDNVAALLAGALLVATMKAAGLCPGGSGGGVFKDTKGTSENYLPKRGE